MGKGRSGPYENGFASEVPVVQSGGQVAGQGGPGGMRAIAGGEEEEKQARGEGVAGSSFDMQVILLVKDAFVEVTRRAGVFFLLEE